MTTDTVQSRHNMASEALGLWEPRRTLTLEAARRHSGRIKFLRRALSILALALVGWLVWEFSQQGGTTFPEDDPSEAVKMVNPRYSGRTEDGLPFYLTAKEAVRLIDNDEEVELISPVLEFYRDETSAKSIVVAKSGTYDDMKKILNLRTDVDLTTDDGFDCETTHARVFARTKTIEGDEPIFCTGNFGKVRGNAYEILDNYRTFIFKDKMSAELEQD